jgi:FAD/FMN-containing dehydrogenase
LFDFLDELDSIVMKHKGRIYLSKDARMKPEIFWQSYPKADKFQDILRKYDPNHKFNSILARRLKITQ